MVVGEGFGPAAVPASKSGKLERPGLALETDQHERRRTLRAKGLVAGCQGIQEKIFISAHGRTPLAMVAPSQNELEWHLFAGCEKKAAGLAQSGQKRVLLGTRHFKIGHGDGNAIWGCEFCNPCRLTPCTPPQTGPQLSRAGAVSFEASVLPASARSLCSRGKWAAALGPMDVTGRRFLLSVIALY
jgi:hypothetical protein